MWLAWRGVSGAITKRAIADAPNNAGDQALGVIVSLVSFTALISVGIGIMNLLPLPILDGGHLLFYAYEWLAKRPLESPCTSRQLSGGSLLCWSV